VHTLALGPEEGKELHRVRPGIAEPMGYPGVELGCLARGQYEIVFAEHKPEPPV
jgi:hypothetical protein